MSLYFPNGPTETSQQMDRQGGLFSQTDSPNQHDVIGSGRFPTNGFHNLSIDCDLAHHRATHYLDGRAFSITSIKPGCDTSAIFIKFWMASAKPTTTTLIISNLMVQAFSTSSQLAMASSGLSETAATAVTAGAAGVSQNSIIAPNQSVVLYQTKFESPQFRIGNLVGQDEWYARGGWSQNGAKIVPAGDRRRLVLSGPDMEMDRPNHYKAEYVRPLFFEPLKSGNSRVSFSGDLQLQLGEKSKEANDLFLQFFLSDRNARGLVLICLDKQDTIFGQNWNPSGNETIAARTKGGNQRHNLRVDLDFASRRATFFVDHVVFGMLPINPSADASVGSLRLMLVSSAPIDSTLFVENLRVDAFEK
jgi:hypothetical protein